MIGRAVNFKSSSGGNFIINNQISQPGLHSQSPYWFVFLDSVDGLSSADISYESHPVPYGIGEVSGDVLRRGKSITLSGRVKGMTVKAVETVLNFLSKCLQKERSEN